MTKAQEIQNKIYREMPDRKKMEMTINFMRTGKVLSKTNEISRTRKLNQNRPSPRLA